MNQSVMALIRELGSMAGTICRVPGKLQDEEGQTRLCVVQHYSFEAKGKLKYFGVLLLCRPFVSTLST